VTDDFAVQEVRVNITYPNTSSVNESMIGGSFYYNTTYSQIGTYSYYIWANDTRGNSNKTSSYTFRINDPPIADFSYEPISPQTSQTIYFNSTSTDSDGSIVNWTWNMDDRTILYGEQVTHQYTSVGIYNVELTVKDNDDATDNANATITVTSGDMIPPQIFNVDANPNPQTQGDFVNITCDVTDDDSGVNVVKVHIVDPLSGVINVTMQMTRGSYYYKAQYNKIGIHEYHIWTKDNAGNGNISPTFEFLIEEPEGGWQLISEPISSVVSLDSLTVEYNATSYTWNDAVTLGIVDPNVFGWSRILQTYTVASSITPGEGYW
jgi:PKD repeat protein